MTETLKKGTRVTGADRTKLASELQKRYSAGESIRALAASTGRSYGFIHRILAESGVTLRSRGGATRGPPRPRASPTASSQTVLADGALRLTVDGAGRHGHAGDGPSAGTR